MEKTNRPWFVSASCVALLSEARGKLGVCPRPTSGCLSNALPFDRSFRVFNCGPAIARSARGPVILHDLLHAGKHITHSTRVTEVISRDRTVCTRGIYNSRASVSRCREARSNRAKKRKEGKYKNYRLFVCLSKGMINCGRSTGK